MKKVRTKPYLIDTLMSKTVAVLAEMAAGYHIKVKPRTPKLQLARAVARAVLSDPSYNRKKKQGRKWYVIRCAPGKEASVRRDVKRKAAKQLLHNKFGKILTIRHQSLELKKGQRILTRRKRFPNYLLANMVLDHDTSDLVTSTFYCLGFLTETCGYADESGAKPDPTRPWALDDDEANLIIELDKQDRVKRTDCVQVNTGLERGDRVRITEGAFKDAEGTVRRVAGEGTKNPVIEVGVRFMGIDTKAEFRDWQVEKVEF